MTTQNPWIGFAHADHQPSELEPLVRTLRYALIDLQKFWVEVQSIPVLKSGLSSHTLEEMEKILGWIISSPEWSEQIQTPRLIAELAHPETRKRVQEFARSVLCVRSILDELNWKAAKAGCDLKSLDELWKNVSEARQIVERRKGEKVSELKLAEIDVRLGKAKESWSEIDRVLKYFDKVSKETGAPQATTAQEGFKVLRALEMVSQMPEAVRPWRSAHVLEASQKIRLQAWRDRARPILELRKRLETFFDLDADVTIEELSQLAEALKAEGLFAQFKAPYKEALEKYRTLLRGGVAVKVDNKSNGFQKAEKLKEWMSLIEQSKAYAQHVEAKQAFAPRFQGVDTDFAAALEANAWAQSVRDKFLGETGETLDSPMDGVSYKFDLALIEFITRIPEERIEVAAGLSSQDDARWVEDYLKGAVFAKGGSFASIEMDRRKRSRDFRRLQEIAGEIELSSDIPMSELGEIAQRTEEAYFLIQRIESDALLKASLKELYAGIHTDLSAIEPCASYVKSVKSMQLPSVIEAALLSVHGPQRLSDASSLAARCLPRLAILHEHYRKLEAATREEVRVFAKGKELESAPLVELMDRIQTALKNAQHLAEAVAELRAKCDSGWTGLKVDHVSPSVSSPVVSP